MPHMEILNVAVKVIAAFPLPWCIFGQMRILFACHSLKSTTPTTRWQSPSQSRVNRWAALLFYHLAVGCGFWEVSLADLRIWTKLVRVDWCVTKRWAVVAVALSMSYGEAGSWHSLWSAVLVVRILASCLNLWCRWLTWREPTTLNIFAKWLLLFGCYDQSLRDTS